MEISNELILGPADIDQLSIRCKSCRAESRSVFDSLALSGTDRASKETGHADLPTKCPSCDQDWTKVYGTLARHNIQLPGADLFGVGARLELGARLPELPAHSRDAVAQELATLDFLKMCEDDFDDMAWTVPKHPRKEVDRAGIVLISRPATSNNFVPHVERI